MEANSAAGPAPTRVAQVSGPSNRPQARPLFPVQGPSYNQLPRQPIFHPDLQHMPLMIHEYHQRFTWNCAVCGINGSRNSFLPPGESNIGRPNVDHCANRPYGDLEYASYFNQPYHSQQRFSNQNRGVRPGIPMGPARGFFYHPGSTDVPPFHGSVSQMCYGPVNTAGVMMGALPHFVSHAPQHVRPAFVSQELNLRNAIVKQIEYYFSDENLPRDNYLLSLLSEQGWVHVAKIADFRRVKLMTKDISLILDALRSSNSIEVQGEMIRRRNDWSKWVHKSGNPTANVLEVSC